MKFRRTPERLMTARLAFLSEVEVLLPNLVKDQCPSLDDQRVGRRGSIAERAAALFGELPERLRAAGYAGDNERAAFARKISVRAEWARGRAGRYAVISGHRSITGWLPAGYGFDGEVPKQLAAVLVARRKAWSDVGKPLGSEEWRTLDVAQALVALLLPLGGYKIHREVVLAGGLAEFRGRLVLDEVLATRGGLYRAEHGENGECRLVGLGKRIGPYVIARTLIKENGKFLAPEIIRRLRNGVVATFDAGKPNRWSATTETRVTILAGRKLSTNTALSARVHRLECLATRHGEIAGRISEAGRELARTFAAEQTPREAESRSRFDRAFEEFSHARDRYNTAAARLCFKDSIRDLPFASPPSAFPRPRASIGVGDRRTITSTQSSFCSSWSELNEARRVLSEFDPEAARVPVAPPDAEAIAAPEIAPPAYIESDLVLAGE